MVYSYCLVFFSASYSVVYLSRQSQALRSSLGRPPASLFLQPLFSLMAEGIRFVLWGGVCLAAGTPGPASPTLTLGGPSSFPFMERGSWNVPMVLYTIAFCGQAESFLLGTFWKNKTLVPETLVRSPVGYLGEFNVQLGCRSRGWTWKLQTSRGQELLMSCPGLFP